VDFSLEEQQLELRTLTAELLAREASVERVTAHEQSGAAFDTTTWKAMAQAGLLGLVLPEDEGGMGFGAVELGVVLTEVGRRTAPVPALATLALGALPVARLGTAAQRAELLPGVADGDVILTAGWREPGGTVSTTAENGKINGVKVGVPYAAQAHRILVTTQTGVFLVDPAADGVTLTPSFTSHGHPESRLVLDNADAEQLGTGPAQVLEDHAAAAYCAAGTGVLAEALRITTEHVRTREQFGRPLAAFQAVAGQVADVYITSKALELATASASWQLSTGRDARAHLGVAGYWLAEHGVRALHTCQHLHGGLGVDVTYPLHRYFAWARYLAHSLGGAGHQVETLGTLGGEVA
jgi:alkylation response protein AidB-like acyl-CoA dehydrogenase